MLQLGYIALTVTMILIILYGYNYALTAVNTAPSKRKKRVFYVFLGILLWLTYASVLGLTGVLENFELPPRFPLLLVIPAFIFTGIFLSKNRHSAIIKAIPKSWPVYYQSFRILVESLFVLTVAEGLLHPEVTFEGYNYDILFGVTALIIGFLVFTRNMLSQKIALYWNYLGLAVIAVIIFLFTTTLYFPSFWGSTVPLAPKGFINFPYVFVPAFLMPSAVFIHVLSIIQLKNNK